MGAMLLGRGRDVKEEQIPAAVKGSQAAVQGEDGVA